MGVLSSEYAAQSAEPKRSPIIPIALIGALVLAAATWIAFVAGRDDASLRTFDNPQLGCRFTYPSRLVSGPNFVSSKSGAVFTIERHSLFEAEKEFLRNLPDALYPQVKIQLDQTFRDLRELRQTHGTLGGRPSLHVDAEGKPGVSKSVTSVTVNIAATEDWVYVLRATIPTDGTEEDRAAFDIVRRSFEFLPEGGAPPDPS